MAKKKSKGRNKVLYFDNERFIPYSLAENLELFGWNVTLVSESDELFEQLRNHLFDILILDIMAPIPELKNEYVIFSKSDLEEMDGGIHTGIVLAKKIWEMDSYKNTPILFFSSMHFPDSIHQFMNEGKKCDYLCKPELSRIINERLDLLLNS